MTSNSMMGGHFKVARLAVFVAIALTALNSSVQARDYFNPRLLELDNPDMKGADLSAFETGSQAPGKYRVDIIINEQMVDSKEVEFKSVKDAAGQDQLQPCLTVSMLQSYGVKTELFPALGAADDCADISAIPEASYDFSFNTQKLLVNIPQAAISQMARGAVPSELWDEGIAAAMLNYSLSGANSHSHDGGNTSNQYANIRPGFNYGPWRARNYTTLNRGDNGETEVKSVYTYLQRGIVPLKGQLTLGDSSSPADVFDSVPFRGGQLASDDDMLPDSLKGYAPVVRGIARTNAQVIVRQNSYIIYQTYVAPGAFEISDMYPTGGAGDLNVTVKESDGSQQNYVVPFASLPLLQREGRLKYAATVGQYRSYNNDVNKAALGQMSAIYGLPKEFTVYGGLQGSSKYRALALGVGKNMGDIGALSTDVTQAWSSPLDMDKSSGQSMRIRYSKNFINTGTNFAIAGYRYSTSGYYSMQEVLDSYGNQSALESRRRNRMELTVSQSMGDTLGALTTSAVREDYWYAGKSMESYNVGYNNAWRSISYGVSYTYSKNGSVGNGNNSSDYDKDQIIAFNISVPLESFMPSTWASYSLNSSKNNGSTHSAGINGVALEDNALSWGVQQGYSAKDVGYSGSMNADYRGTYGEASTGYSYDKSGQRVNYALQGGVIAHGDGITLSQQLGETNVLVKAPGASGVGVTNVTGAKTDYRGYTAVSNVSAFRKNDISLETETLPDDVELELTTTTVVPTRGAVVRADFATNVGMRVLMTLLRSDGKTVPFGATVSDSANPNTKAFIVGDQGQVYLTGLAESGKLNVRWGQNAKEQCTVEYKLNADTKISGIFMAQAKCL